MYIPIAQSLIALMLSTDTSGIGQLSAQSPQDAVDGDSNDAGPDREQLVFPREFFAEANPSTAHDIVRRVPGFQIDEDEALRGFSVAVGNIGDANLKRLAVNLRVPLNGVGIPGAFATVEGRYDHTRVSDPTTGRSRKLTGVRPFEGAVRFEQDVPGYDVSWGVSWLPYYRHPTYEPDQQRYFRLKNYFIAFARWQVDETLSIRVQGTVWDDFEQGRDVYLDRQGRDIAFIERQYTDPREFLTLNLRKTF